MVTIELHTRLQESRKHTAVRTAKRTTTVEVKPALSYVSSILDGGRKTAYTMRAEIQAWVYKVTITTTTTTQSFLFMTLIIRLLCVALIDVDNRVLVAAG